MDDETRRKLENLVKRANILKGYGLDKHLLDTGFRFYVRHDNSVDFDRPDDKELDASLLNIRLFTQKKDEYSFLNLENIAKDSGLSDGFRKYLIKTGKGFTTFFRGHPSQIRSGFFEEGKQPTNKEIFNVVMYGTRSHENMENLYKRWARDNIRENVLNQAFNKITLMLLLWIFELAEKCEEELERNLSSRNN